MNEDGYLLVQVNIICLLLALISATAIIQHPDWFGKVPIEWKFVAPQSN